MHIRIFKIEDIPQIVSLHGRAFGISELMPVAQLEATFHEYFFESPWFDSDLPSWVCESNDGSLLGFIGVLPRMMTFRGEPLRVAAATQLMVDPTIRAPQIAMQLLSRVFAGNQDLIITDGATEVVRRIWLALGGTTAQLYSMHWTRPVRPARFFSKIFTEHLGRGGSLLRLVATPFCKAVDVAFLMLVANKFPKNDPDISVEPLDAAGLLAGISEVTPRTSITPEYDLDSLGWLLKEVEKSRKHGQLRSVMLRVKKGQLIGWYLYFVNPGDVSEVLQVAAAPGKEDQVFGLLLADALQHGATAVQGRFEPSLVEAMTQRQCYFTRSGCWTLMHSQREELLNAMHAGDAFFSRLDAEWWAPFVRG